MAFTVTINGQEYKHRNPWGVFALSAITLGIYFLVWYYKINDEVRRFLQDETIRPAVSVVALFVPIVNLVSIWRCGERIVRVEEKTGAAEQLSPFVALLLSFVTPFQSVYMQSHLNGVWLSASAEHPAGELERR